MAVGALLCGSGLAATAQPPNLHWQGGACGEDWQIDSPALPLRDILERLAAPMGFELEYLAQQNPPREGRFRGDARGVLNQLAGRASLITTGHDDPDCPGAWRPTRVIVLPLGEAGELPVASDVPEGLQRYRRAHGMDPLSGELVGHDRDGDGAADPNGDGEADPDLDGEGEPGVDGADQ